MRDVCDAVQGNKIYILKWLWRMDSPPPPPTPPSAESSDMRHRRRRRRRRIEVIELNWISSLVKPGVGHLGPSNPPSSLD